MVIRVICEDCDQNDAVKSIYEILQDTYLCSMATINPDYTCHINTAYFAFDDDLTLCFRSDPETRHCRNLCGNAQTAITVFSTEQPWGKVGLKGVQLFGTAAQADGSAASRADDLYRKRFPEFAIWIDELDPAERIAVTAKYFLFVTSAATVLDEEIFGEEKFVTAQIERVLAQ